MARGKFIHPQIWGDSRFCQLSPWGRLFWIGLFDNSDDEGFITGDACELNSKVFPRDNKNLDEILQLLAEIKSIMSDSIMILEVQIGNKTEEVIYLKNYWDFQPVPDYPIPSEWVNLLIDKGVSLGKDILKIHRDFSRKRVRILAKVRHNYRYRSRSSVSVGVGVGVGVKEKDLKDGELKKENSPQENISPKDRISELTKGIGKSSDLEQNMADEVYQLWLGYFKEKGKFNFGVIKNMLRGDGDFRRTGPIPLEKIKEFVTLTNNHHIQKPLADTWGRFLDVVHRNWKYVD